MRICLAGKNEIAVFGLNQLLERGIDKNEIVVLTNNTDSGEHNWQPSLKKFSKIKGVREGNIEELYGVRNLVFLSLEYDKIINTNSFIAANIFNIHFSLLPSYKGMYTSIFPILYGEKYSGVTLHEIDNGIDTGPIIDQIRFDLYFGMLGIQLYNLYLKYSKELLLKNIDSIINGNYKSNPQSIINSSYFSKRSIDFKNLNINFVSTCYQICNFINAFSFRPYQLITFNNCGIIKAVPSNKRSLDKPGKIIYEDDYIIEVSSIDYNVILIKDNLDDLLFHISSNNLSKVKAYHQIDYPFSDKNYMGRSPIIVACYNGCYDIVEYLIQNHLSDINDKDYNGTTTAMYALLYAAKNQNDLRVLEYLIFNGVDLHLKDYNDKSIFDYANILNNKSLINFLKRYI